jgi:hypothetical protein
MIPLLVSGDGIFFARRFTRRQAAYITRRRVQLGGALHQEHSGAMREQSAASAKPADEKRRMHRGGHASEVVAAACQPAAREGKGLERDVRAIIA